jgi:hypothetical protein
MSLSTKLASLLVSLGLGLAASGCYVQAGVDITTPVAGPAQVDIDPGASMASTPGEGVGLFVEYAGNGHWNVFTTCDTNISGAACSFDVVLSADPGVFLDNVQGQDLSGGDVVALHDDGSIHLVAETSFGMNGLSFDADPGAAIEVDMLLDGSAQPRFVYSVSGGVLQDGAPSNPVDFVPAGI